MKSGTCGPVTEALREEYREGFRMFAEAVGRISEEEWGKGGNWTEVPARTAMHTLLCARFYIAETGDGFEWSPGGVEFWGSPVSELPSRGRMLEEVAACGGETDRYLVENGDEGLMREKAGTNPGRTRVANMIYGLRHLQQHVGQMSAECKRRGFGAARWEV